MKSLKRLCVAIALTLTIALSVMAGEIPSPPAPGETQAPPCACGQMTLDESGAASSAANEYSVSDAALELAQLLLAIF